ncbi:MAG: 16S rRNA (cytidine(1402)-2'-O)-methyltransferase [Bacteroidetes bacterium]|nr:16S rRNA (cytidine(1402)-2'-O)-methyltransferase [Bacteroidota bacterium]
MSKLYLIPTPIGNLEDITLRALRLLREEVQLVLAEDTRKTGQLLKHYGISVPMAAYHQHNEHRITGQFVNRMLAGEVMGLITDAGTPAISDPGYLLVRECIKAGLTVECLPGPTAFVPALVSSGLPADRFLFLGFLPHKKGRLSRIAALKEVAYTTVLYESPHRLLKTLEQMAEVLGGDRQASVSRELSKLHEETLRGSLNELKNHFSDKPARGEIVIVLAAAQAHKQSDEADETYVES